MIITEGPSMPNKWTITALDIAPYVDILVTTNDMGKSKIDGLFGTVLQKFGIKPDDMIFIGDSAARDVAPARAEGIWSWLYDEKNNCKFEVEAPRINSLLKMKHILGRMD
jgi:putative hydrolase of the HAD superfamily